MKYLAIVLLFFGVSARAAMTEEKRYASSSACARYLTEVNAEALKDSPMPILLDLFGGLKFGEGRPSVWRHSLRKRIVLPTITQVQEAISATEEGDYDRMQTIVYAEFSLVHLAELLGKLVRDEFEERKLDPTFSLDRAAMMKIAGRLAANSWRNRTETSLNNLLNRIIDVADEDGVIPLDDADLTPSPSELPERLLTGEEQVKLMAEVAILLKNPRLPRFARQVLVTYELAANYLQLPLVQSARDFVEGSHLYLRPDNDAPFPNGY